MPETKTKKDGGVKKSALSSIKKKYNWYPVSTGTENRDVRMVKMLEPACATHKDVSANWIEICEAEGHDPFATMTEHTELRPVYETDEAGDKFIKGTKEIVLTSVIPNVTQIALARGINDGRGVEKAESQGYVHLFDAGYIPFCELYNCFEESNRMWSGDGIGFFCSQYHKGVILLGEENIPIHVTNPGLRRKQILEAANGS